MFDVITKIKRWPRTFLISLLMCIVVACFFLFPVQMYKILIAVHVPETNISQLYGYNAKILYMLGNRHLGGEGTYDLKKAEEFYTKAIEQNEKLLFVHYQRARVYFLTTRYQLAIDEVNREILNNPNFSRTYYLRGLIYGYDRKLPEAASDFTEFILREPDEWAGYNDLAWILFQLGEYQGVKEAMEQILPRTKNAWLLNAYGVALLNLDEYENALTALLEAKDLSSRMTPEMWGSAYTGNVPIIYQTGLEEMRRNIDENIEIVNNRLSKI